MSPVEFKHLPFTERPDLTPYLVHLTRGTEEEDRYTALDNLLYILRTGEIWGSTTDTGFIQGSQPAACFMDVPLIALKYICTKKNRDRYEPYGLIVGKRYAYEVGARPVLYLSRKEQRILRIANDQLWRVVRLEVSGEGWVSWLHEREWRCPGSFQLPSKLVGVLVKTSDEAVELQRHIQRLARKGRPVRAAPRAIIPLSVVCQGLVY